MRPLMLLSGLAARALGRRRPTNPMRPAADWGEPNMPSPDWYESTGVSEWCVPDGHCYACGADGDCYRCDTIEGRRMDEANEYVCDGCGELIEGVLMDDNLTVDPDTHLAYCPECVGRIAAKPQAYRVWECEHGCGEAAVYTDLDTDRQDCPGCGHPMATMWSRSSFGVVGEEPAACKDGSCGHEGNPCADRREANRIGRWQASTGGYGR